MSKKVFIGVGHGGSDPGAVKYITEKEYTLKTTFALSEFLSQHGVDYKLSRTQDIDTDMNSKVKMCNSYNPDLVVDIHFNAMDRLSSQLPEYNTVIDFYGDYPWFAAYG